ncbi:ABC transporter ATP-binding protein [Actinoalloteichus hymeniacidonis]|uniref:ABC-type multidrug transport system, ATPase component n=1 Tax=Actinoalloteichus hymeniacidonis TaxID=340345 RepID=A0AAC9HMU6_9PSEU|nr:ATP-binding cassette domain-containing protein [Actinoalloteichus hymeniacidonis]AOS62239.1 ABC-type multidrug transport system, ATPase component [Actinoalloteichus hymeniacidonis]MBB5909735.1 ABC-2 type transport system ATP-binding protein [Actinoalloteichus hymeniacidonis]
MIELAHLTKSHGTRRVVDDVGFRIAAGRVTGFLGPNGAGKSSTLRIILGLDRADSGTALIGGQPYRALRHPLRTVGALLDGGGAHRSRTGRAHLTWVARSNGIRRSRIDEVLATVGLTEAADRRVGRYSLGMNRRLGLATALLGEPELLILDEPVNGMDPGGIRWIRHFLRQYAAEGNTVFLSSHLMGETAETADDLVVIDKGRIVTQGSVAEITAGHSSLEDAFLALTDGDFGVGMGHAAVPGDERGAE